MTPVDNIECIIMSRPVIEVEQPFYITFDVSVGGEIMHATFVGEFARQLVNNILTGDKAIIRRALAERNTLVFDFMHLDETRAVGHNVDVVC